MAAPNTANVGSGTLQSPGGGLPDFPLSTDCEQQKKPVAEGGLEWTDCDEKQLCGKVKSLNKLQRQNKLVKQPPGASKATDYASTKRAYKRTFAKATEQRTAMSEAYLDDAFFDPCAKEEWEKDGRSATPTKQTVKGKAGSEKFNADHVHDCGLGGNLKSITNFKMLSQSVNMSIGPTLSPYDPTVHGKITLPKCNCR